MPHATEGELHAYLDGALASVDPAAAERLAAHLRSCPDCEARLAGAATARDRSAELLEAALGEVVAPPPFEQVLARAGRPVSGARRSAALPWSHPSRLAWAASLVVALGAGWMGHALLRGGPSPVERSTAAAESNRESALEEALVASSEARPAQSPAADETGNAAAAAPAFAGRPERRAEASPVESRELRDRATPTAETSAEPVGGRMADAPSEGKQEALVDLSPTALAAVRDSVSAPALDALAQEARVTAAEGQAAAKRADPALPLAQARRPAEADAPPAAAEEAASSAAEPDALADVDAYRALSWRAAGAEEASAWLAAPLPRVAGLDLLDAAIAASAEARLARVRQRLPGGETVELFVEVDPAGAGGDERTGQLQAAPSPAGAPAIRNERVAPATPAETETPPRVLNLAWVRMGVARVLVIAPVAPDSLRVLVSRIR